MSTIETTSAPARFWREPEFGLLLVLVLALYMPRLTDTTIRGEESRWATVAQQMLATGDFLVPRQQGLPFPDRPPLHCWTIAACLSLFGSDSLFAVRLPSVLAMLVTCGVIYAYGRRFLSPLGALAAGAGYASMLQVLQLGRLAESDSLFACLLSAALLIWHGMYLAGRGPLVTWSTGYALAALAALTKGPQAPIYFVGVTLCYLLLVRRDWRFCVSWQHALGACVFVIMLGSWQIPFARAIGSSGVLNIWTEEGHLAGRFNFLNTPGVVKHWLTYPFEIIGATLPWSLMLAVYANRWIYRVLAEARPYALFLATCIAVTLPTCWLPVYSVTRYFMPLFPCLALLAGLAIERCVESGEVGWWQASWRRYRVGAAWLIGLTGFAVGMGLYWPKAPHIWQPPWVLLFAVVALVTGRLLFRYREGRTAWQHQLSLLLIAAFCGLVYLGPVTNIMIDASTNPRDEIAAVKRRLPEGVSLVSLGRLHHLFAYYYRDPIPQLPWPTAGQGRGGEGSTDQPSTVEQDSTDPFEYFCFTENRDEPQALSLPFAWERVAVVSCDRTKLTRLVDVVVIGRRRLETARAPSHQAQQ